VVSAAQIWALLRRTLRGLFPATVMPADQVARIQLKPNEWSAFRVMDPRDRDHGARVAARLLAAHPDAPGTLIRAAYLHDVGKALRPYRVVERVLVHLWTPSARTAAHFPAAVQHMWAAHREHAERGAAHLVALGVDEEVVRWVARHHRPGGELWLERLAAADAAA
jgi:putative nucleotidyltransferase with HDIG domain